MCCQQQCQQVKKEEDLPIAASKQRIKCCIDMTQQIHWSPGSSSMQLPNDQ